LREEKGRWRNGR